MSGKIVEIPLLAIRNTVIFPVLAFPINVGREKSLKAVDRAMEGDRLMGIVAQTDAKLEDPSTDELHVVGTAVKILKSVKMPGNKLNVIIQGLSRIKILEFIHTEPYLKARVQMIEEEEIKGVEVNALLMNLREQAQKIIELSPHIPSEASFLVKSIDNPAILSDIVASNLSVSVEEKQGCSRRSTSRSAWTRSSPCWARRSRSWSSPTRSRPRSRGRWTRPSGSTSCGSR